MIIDHHDLRNVRESASEQTVALTVGCFDIVHGGHLEQLKFAADQADILVVGVMSDEYTRRKKGPGRPINDEQYRAANIGVAPEVDYSFVAPLTSFALAQTVLNLRPDVFVEHMEHKSGRGQRLKTLFLGALAIELVTNYSEKIDSTTDMLRKFGIDGALERSLRFGDLSIPESNGSGRLTRPGTFSEPAPH